MPEIPPPFYLAEDSPKMNHNRPINEPYTMEPVTKKQKINESTDVSGLDKTVDTELFRENIFLQKNIFNKKTFLTQKVF
jgi:hypothetical protein